MDAAINAFKEIVITVGIVIGMLCVLALCFWMYPTMTDAKKMDCSLVEFSPDVTLEVKQACREARRKT
jgi:hypothetical protein